jgi:hypothetical protein
MNLGASTSFQNWTKGESSIVGDSAVSVVLMGLFLFCPFPNGERSTDSRTSVGALGGVLRKSWKFPEEPPEF